MALEFIGKDDTSKNQGSPAVFVDRATGELVFQGWTETDMAVLAEISSYSRTAANESSVRVPARMKPAILKALEALDGETAD
ncbi:hypothetical protein J4573_43095 [Actinomadura barringtoniae]|uniref:Uncharacterized protein n=1 Tax=Actinomadura barringtoniae TaxID=1427535 RepID=A0A939T8A5_9ACTN|nr:hypothetical protein [Actinomadura barringtoniae]